ncbi:sensor histidine kinase [Dyella caseinilytica]|uniref:Histidine kinase n=1 Tax=Dyella caseinilytica TaxID=1849581 RepID=A0ABX7GYH6_9GAMM|nr:histidine kinase [Dyella caseinilytica]QRN55556.1 histidine kinase [Dyella caseinilytica]GGA02646.1 ATPase [Dyella caseinilytica]
MTNIRPDTHSTRWIWIAAIWCAGALFDASQTILTMHAMGARGAWLSPFVIEFVCWLPWALATPFIVELARRQPIVRGAIVKAAIAHLVAFAIVSTVAEAWSAMLQVIFNPWHHKSPPIFIDTWYALLSDQILTFVIAYALILTVTYVVDSREKVQRQMSETARLNGELSRAQLAALRSQMDPHFMFNTLNSIVGLVRDQRNDAAIGMIVGLSEFLRRASEDSHRAQVTLTEEIEYLQRYIDIQKVRFGDRLRVSLNIPVELGDAQVPSLLLQPLVENAIKHGVSKRIAGGEIRVAGARCDDTLRLTVYNDGPWVREDLDATSGGVGLGNLRTRLQILHGDRSDLLLRPADTGGVEVVVTLPFLEA